MTPTSDTPAGRTPLFPLYERYGARVVDFHGWDLPVQFSGIIDEHRAVRSSAGLFDVSHMGEIEINGVEPFSLLEPKLAAFRNAEIGFVFQEHHLLPQYSVLENVLVPTLAANARWRSG